MSGGGIGRRALKPLIGAVQKTLPRWTQIRAEPKAKSFTAEDAEERRAMHSDRKEEAQQGYGTNMNSCIKERAIRLAARDINKAR